MNPRGVLVVAETPSLGRALGDLLEAEGVPAVVALDAALEGDPVRLGERFAILLVASHGYYCQTARRWLQGEFPGLALVVVGSRDARLDGAPGVERIDLPLDAARLLRSVQAILAGASGGPGTVPASPKSPGPTSSVPSDPLGSPSGLRGETAEAQLDRGGGTPPSVG